MVNGFQVAAFPHVVGLPLAVSRLDVRGGCLRKAAEVRAVVGRGWSSIGVVGSCGEIASGTEDDAVVVGIVCAFWYVRKVLTYMTYCLAFCGKTRSRRQGSCLRN